MDGKPDPKIWAVVTVFVAIIGCVGVLGAAVISTLGPQALKSSATITVIENASVPQVIVVNATAFAASVESPLQSNQDSMNCSFIDELVTKSDVIQNLYEGQSLAGVQARLIYPVDVPAGWTVQYDGNDYFGPVHFDSGLVVSFWSPNSCRPLSIGNSSKSNDSRDFAAKTLGYADLDDFMQAFGIPDEVKSRIFVCPGEESWCLSLFEEPGQPDFHFKNVSSCTIDGKQASGASTIPEGFDGMIKGFTIRPCR